MTAMVARNRPCLLARAALLAGLGCAAACAHDQHRDGPAPPSPQSAAGSRAVDRLIEDVRALEGASPADADAARRRVERDAKAVSAHDTVREARGVAGRFRRLDPEDLGPRHARLAQTAVLMDRFTDRLEREAEALLSADLRQVDARAVEVDRTTAVLKALLQAFRHELGALREEIEHE
jgi:hypothetical protein